MPMAAHTLPPPLREGDRLTSDEFMRRWEAMPDLKRAELIDGTVYMPSPVSRTHSRFHQLLFRWITAYEDRTPGCETSLRGTWLMGPREAASPDTTLRIFPASGGQSSDAGDYTAGAPELALEVAVSSRARDLGVKLKMYERKGVREYLVAVTRQQQFLWKEQTLGLGFRPLEPNDDGIFRSRCFPGLWLDPDALWRLDLDRLFVVLEQGLSTPEHAAFVARLARPQQ